MLTHLFERRTDLIWSYLIPRLSDYSNRSALMTDCKHILFYYFILFEFCKGK